MSSSGRRPQVRPGSLSWRRLAVIVGALVLVALGLAGLVLPVLPGIVFLLAALALLTREFQWARNLLDFLRRVERDPVADAPEEEG